MNGRSGEAPLPRLSPCRAAAIGKIGTIGSANKNGYGRKNVMLTMLSLLEYPMMIRVLGAIVGAPVGRTIGAGTGIVGGHIGAVAGFTVFTLGSALWGFSAGPDLARVIQRQDCARAVWAVSLMTKATRQASDIFRVNNSRLRFAFQPRGECILAWCAFPR